MTELITSNVVCVSCDELIGVHWFLRITFFVIILAVTVVTGIVFLVDQGVYAALLMLTVPLGVIGYVKARFCSLEVKRRKPTVSEP